MSRRRGNFSTAKWASGPANFNRANINRRYSPLPSHVRARATLLSLEDRREFHPAIRWLRPARALRRDAARVVERHGGTQARRAVFGFNVPNLVSICVRRKVRREVLLAMGRGGGGKRRPRRNSWSDIVCGKR